MSTFLPAGMPAVSATALPLLSVTQMVQVDRLMVETFGINLQQMMENAGRNLADLSQAWLGGRVAGRPILVLAGKGNNGGGGMAAARHLANRGADVQVVATFAADDPAATNSASAATAHQTQILMNMGISVMPAGDGWELPSADLILDALIGYGLSGAPSGEVAGLIRLANSHPAPVLALDIPSGLDASTGVVHDPCIRAAATLSLALPKRGLFVAPQAVVGQLYLADISVPASLYADLGLDIEPPFFEGPILHLIRDL